MRRPVGVPDRLLRPNECLLRFERGADSVADLLLPVLRSRSAAARTRAGLDRCSVGGRNGKSVLDRGQDGKEPNNKAGSHAIARFEVGTFGVERTLVDSNL